MLKPSYLIPDLPPAGVVLETPEVLKALAKAHRYLAELKIRSELPKIYSQDLLSNLFRHPYTRIEFVQRDLNVTRQTASKYLKQLVEKGVLDEHTHRVSTAISSMCPSCS